MAFARHLINNNALQQTAPANRPDTFVRLTKIKLSGFKSFVDPVSIPVSGNLVGIVGPNGCGKSNIIDAVRWVMGESSAKHLRGGTMADVIFNGSASRKPVGMASVELLFDNSASKGGGPYAAYTNISIKRQVSRDGQSVYMLNGARCRRKDITDLFLGTGLGTRSYAIIEQGTISRLVEAKPEDLRVMIEEAAGISKYKDRRHDTEIRIRHTRENLERLNDVRDEVDKQIRHLKQQAKKAETFKELKAEERRLRKELLAIRWHAYREQVTRCEQNETQAKHALESASKLHSELERQIASSREEQNRLQHTLNTAQGDLYASGAEIARIEQTLKLANQSRQEIESELARLSSEKKRAVNELDHDKSELTRIRSEIVLSTKKLELAGHLQETFTGFKACAERLRMRQQENLASIRNELASQKERMQVEGSKIDQFVDQNRQHAARRQRLIEEKRELESAPLNEEIAALKEQIESLEEQHDQVREECTNLKQQSDSQKKKIREYNDILNGVRSKRQHCEGRIASLERLQQHAMGRDRALLNRWLSERQLQHSRRLAQDIEVENGWEAAVELALGSHLEAVCVDDAKSLLEEIAQLSEETLAVIETGPGCTTTESHSDLPRLLEKVRSSCKVQTLLAGIFCASDLKQARLRMDELAAGESLMTPDGIWLGKGWVYLNRTTDQKTGVLAREKELRDLNGNLAVLEEESASIEAALDALELELGILERRFEEMQHRERYITGQLSELRTSLSAKEARNEQFCRRIAQIEREAADIDESVGRNERATEACRNHRSEAQRKVTALSAQSDQLSESNRVLQNLMTEIGQIATDVRDEVRGLEAGLQHLQSSEQLTSRQLQRLQNQHHQETERANQLMQKLAEVVEPLQGQIDERERLLEKRQRQETELKRARIRLQDCEKTLKQLAEQQAHNQIDLENKREMLEKVRLDGQESRVRSQSVLEQLDELNVEHDAIEDLLPDRPDEKLWSEKIEELSVKITRLGSINLAAIEEFEEQSQRLDYLNGQHADLSESLQTLELAMKKIDTESKTRFKATFDRINSGLQVNFPKLFGGGQARLELCEEGQLESGVNVIARPPGKRNASIHLLSGGEKALTAVALVFSIFELNPAPFCMLDEVDAPLDDANVGRFSRLIEEMSERVQFIFITHNKVTMEIARQLAGVTMNEPGVSRMVAVDIDEAVELAVS